MTGAGDETLRFWNVFPSLKAPVSTEKAGKIKHSFNLSVYIALFIKSFCFYALQALVKDTSLWSLGRTHIR